MLRSCSGRQGNRGLRLAADDEGSGGCVPRHKSLANGHKGEQVEEAKFIGSTEKLSATAFNPT